MLGRTPAAVHLSLYNDQLSASSYDARDRAASSVPAVVCRTPAERAASTRLRRGEDAVRAGKGTSPSLTGRLPFAP